MECAPKTQMPGHTRKYIIEVGDLYQLYPPISGQEVWSLMTRQGCLLARSVIVVLKSYEDH